MQRPLADEIRPKTLDEVVGQKHLLAPGAVLRRLIEAGDGGQYGLLRSLRHRQDHHCQHHRPAAPTRPSTGSTPPPRRCRM